MAKKKSSETEGEGGEAEAPKSKKKLILIALAVLLLAGGGGGFYFWKKKSSAAADHAEQHVAEQKKPATFLAVRDMIVNLTPEPGQSKANFLKLRVVLELKDSKVESEVKPLIPRVEDAFQTYMRELRVSDLAGSVGLNRLREELLRRVSVAIYPAKADAVLFKDVVVQ